MKLSETGYDNQETGCCARLDVGRWDGREIVWKDQLVVQEHIHSVFHVPLDFGKVMTRAHHALETAEAWPAEPMWLSDERSPWGSDVYLPVDREIPGQKMTHLSGRFIAKVFDGPFRDAGKWVGQAHAYVSDRGETPGETYLWYTTCPHCARKLGHNHVVVLTRVAETS